MQVLRLPSLRSGRSGGGSVDLWWEGDRSGAGWILRTEQHNGARAADGEGDDGEREGEKKNVAGEDDTFGAGDDWRLNEGVHAVDDRPGSTDAEGVERSPSYTVENRPSPMRKIKSAARVQATARQSIELAGA